MSKSEPVYISPLGNAVSISTSWRRLDYFHLHFQVFPVIPHLESLETLSAHFHFVRMVKLPSLTYSLMQLLLRNVRAIALKQPFLKSYG